MKSFSYGGVIMKKKHVITITAALAASMAMSVTAFGAPTDIQGHWAQNTINKWVDKGDISGYPDGTFRPNNMITRAEFVVLVNNAMGYSKSGYAYFSDVPNHYWGKNAIQTGVAAGYISGDGDGIFRPNDPVTRQEAAAMISRILGLKQNDSRAYRYTDSYAISNWAKGVVGAVSEAGIMAGYPDGSFGPNKVLTRAEAVLALDKTMNYKPGDKEEDKEETKKEDMLLTQSKLEDTTVTGDLTISDRLGTKTITLEDVTVKGKLIVDGGGEIILKDCNIKEMVMDQKDTAVKASGKTTVEKTTFKKIGKLNGGDYTDVVVDKELSGSITIDAKVRNLTLDAETDLKLGSDARIKNMEITKNADKATIDFSKAKVEDMVVKDKISIRGSGDIDTMTVYVSDVNTSIRPDTVKTKDGASKPNYIDDNDDWYKPSRYRNVTVDRDYSGGTYRNATVTKSDITAKNMTVRENLYIDSDVKDGSVTLEGMTVYGNVYVKGGGENSVYFKDCKISGHIYAEKTYDKYPVGLKLDNKTAQALKGNLYIRGNGADVMGLESGNGTYLKRIVVETSNPVELTDLQAERVDITAANAAVKIPAPTVVKELYVTDKGNGKIELSGTIGKLQADNAITVKGSGRIDEKSGKVEVTEDVKIGVTSVTLDKTDLTLDVNGTAKLNATVKPDDATTKTVTWKSDNEGVAIVDNSGNVTAKAAGTATITATVDGKSASCKVTVNGQTTTVPVQSVGLNTNKVELSVGEENKLVATVTPEAATNKEVTWASSTPEVATVDQDGKVVAQKPGNATITVTTKDGNKTATCEVTVKETPVAVTGVGLNTNKVELSVGEENKLVATITPKEATDQEVTWVCSKPEVATVDQNGKVVAHKPGNTTITVTTKDGNKTATCEVTVKETPVAVTGVGLNTNKVELSVGEENKLVATVTPEAAANRDVTWNSSKPAVATVDSTGKVVAQAPGTTTITVTTVDGNKTATCEVTVKETPVAVTGVGLNTNDLKLSAGEANTLVAAVTPKTATNPKVKWSSNNLAVATVDNNGKVVAQAPGTATITVTTEDGNKTVTCKVTVLSVNKEKLAALMQEGNNLLATPTSTDGSNISPNQKWVTEVQKNALKAAVDTAKAVYDKQNADQNTIDAEYLKLQKAITTFKAAMKPGTMPNTPMSLSFWDLW